MKPNKVRPIAICVFKYGDSIFVAEGYDPVKEQTFYRPLGGSIEFGERGHEAVIREIWEEISQDVENVSYIGTLENIFTYNGEAGHEIVMVYDGEFKDKAMYQKTWITAQENGDTFFKATWMKLDDFGPGAPLYPGGLLNLLATKGARRTHKLGR